MRLSHLTLLGLLAISALDASAADAYTIDPMHTYPSFEFSHMGMSMWRGKFNRSSGKAQLHRAAGTGNIEVTIDTQSIDFGLDKMNEAASSADWLNVAKFPTAVYRGMIVAENGVPARVDGQLTLLGVTRPVSLRIKTFKCMPHPMLKREWCGADAEGRLNRADFGLSQYLQMDGGIILLRIQVEALKDQ
jgi:polyisoprenoid-binding protein YceI